MQHTANLNLNKPEQDDYYNIENENQNMDKLDAEVFKKMTVIKIDDDEDLPEATSENRGITYHIKNDDRFVYCYKKTNEIYGFDTLSYTSGVEANLPDEGIYFATDTLKWYRDKELIIVTEVVNLPNPSFECKGKYYKVGSVLSIGKETPATYGYRPFGLPEIIYKDSSGVETSRVVNKGTIIIPKTNIIPNIPDGYALEMYEV